MTIKIFLGNLSSDTTPDKIRPLFEKYGEVVECDVLKNFGFVHMVNKSEANKAIAQLDGYNIDGNNIRVELSTGKKGGGGGKFDKKGYGNRNRPYGRGDFDRYPYPPMGGVSAFDRVDPYYRFYLERDAFYSRLNTLTNAAAATRERFLPLARERMSERFLSEARDRLAQSRSFLDDRARGVTNDTYFRERESMAARPPPEYYDRKSLRGAADSLGGAAPAARGAGYGNGSGGDFYRGYDRPGAGSGGAGGSGGSDYFRGSGQGGYARGLVGKSGDNQSFAQDGMFF